MISTLISKRTLTVPEMLSQLDEVMTNEYVNTMHNELFYNLMFNINFDLLFRFSFSHFFKITIRNVIISFRKVSYRIVQ